MNFYRLSWGLLVLLLMAFVVSMAAAVPMLPDRVATHFDASGRPNDWMNRSTHILVMSLLGLGFPLFIIGTCWTTRYLPKSAVNIPHRDYWMSEERRLETAQYLYHQSLWLACLGVGFMIGLHWSVVFSNRRQPVELPLSWILGITGPFLLGTAWWVICLYRRFPSPDISEPQSTQNPGAGEDVSVNS